jgi:hypothetical protein
VWWRLATLACSLAARAGIGTTKTKQSQTLFVVNIPRGRQEEVHTIFEKDPGYFKTRLVRSMAFIDYESIPDATKGCVM